MIPIIGELDNELIWLWISSFGVAFALLSFMTEINYFKNYPSYKKGIMSIIFGSLLFYILPYQIYNNIRIEKENVEKKKTDKYNELINKINKKQII